jgi:hypothetical protein
MSRQAELTRLFGHVYVINLPSRKDRRDEMAVELRKVGLDWSSADVTCFPATRPADDGGFRSIGAHGCFLSHLAVIEHAIAAGHESVLIVEDDCNFAASIALKLSQIGAALADREWSMFFAGYDLHGAAPPQQGGGIGRVGAEQPMSLSHCFAVRGAALAALPGYLRLLMSRPGGHPDGGKMDVDGAYTWFRRTHPQFETWIALPQIAYQRSSRTDISPEYWLYALPLLRHLVAGVRKLRNLSRR